jgi:phage terminase Nu1 subunit (DNA packaging protein)
MARNVKNGSGEQTEYIVPTSKIAEIIGVTEQRTNQLAKEGVLAKKAVGKWELIKNLKMYVAWLKSSNGESESLAIQKLKAEVDYKRAKADRAQLTLEELEGGMIRAADVESVMTDHVYAVRAMLVALPGRLAIDVMSASSAAEVSEIIRKEVHTVLDELSEYKFKPEVYTKRVRERQGWGELPNEKESERHGKGEM